MLIIVIQAAQSLHSLRKWLRNKYYVTNNMTDQQFCWQMAIQIASVIATLLLAVIAIWGDAIKSALVGPKLALSINDPLGERIDQSDGRKCRYYHLRIFNERKSAPAHNVRVVLTKLLKPAADDSIPDSALAGSVQLNWRFGRYQPQFPTIGPTMICDLGYLIDGQEFKLSTIYNPNNLNCKVEADQRIHIEVIAVSDEMESKPLRIEIAWDGGWSDDTVEMKRHLVVKEVKQSD